jgi:hypothetical protein
MITRLLLTPLLPTLKELNMLVASKTVGISEKSRHKPMHSAEQSSNGLQRTAFSCLFAMSRKTH